MGVADKLFALIIAALVIDTIAISLRIWIRINVLGSFGYDDTAISIGFVGNSALNFIYELLMLDRSAMLSSVH